MALRPSQHTCRGSKIPLLFPSAYFSLNMPLPLPAPFAATGPRVLEHIVDTVIYMEGGRQQPVRMVRACRPPSAAGRAALRALFSSTEAVHP